MQDCSLQIQSQHPKKSMAASHSSSLLFLFLLYTTQTIITSTPVFASSSSKPPNTALPPLHPALVPNSPFPTASSPSPLVSSASPPPSAAPSLPHTPLPPQPNPTNSPSQTPSSPPPPPPISSASPPPSSTAQEQLNNIIDALIGAGDFNTWSNILSDAGFSTLPLSATLFIPADDSLPQPPLTITIDPFIFPYHMVPQRLSFSDLRLLPPFSRLPTLLAAKTILVTSTSVTNFTLDDTLLSHPDLYTTPAVAVHGIANLLDYNRYGDTKGLATSTAKPSPEVVRPPAPPDNIQGTLLPPGMFMPGDEVVGARKSDAVCLCREFPVVFSVLFGVLALKIH